MYKAFILVGFIFLMLTSQAYANPFSIPTINDVKNSILTSSQVNNEIFSVYAPGSLKMYIFNPLRYWKELVLYIIPVFLLVFLLVYMILIEANIFERSLNLMPALAFIITLISFVSGVVAYVAVVVANFTSLAVLGGFLGIIYIAIWAIYHRTAQNLFPNAQLPQNLLFLFVLNLPLAIAIILVVSIAILIINGSVPLTGKEGAIAGAIVGFLLLGLNR